MMVIINVPRGTNTNNIDNINNIESKEEGNYIRISNAHALHDILKLQYYGTDVDQNYYLDVLLDPGATISTCNEYGYKSLKVIKPKATQDMVVYGFNNKMVKLKEYIDVWIVNKDYIIDGKPAMTNVRFYLVNGSRYNFLMGNGALRELGIKYTTQNKGNINGINLVPDNTGLQNKFRINGNNNNNINGNTEPTQPNPPPPSPVLGTISEEPTETEEIFLENYGRIIEDIDGYPTWNGISIITDNPQPTKHHINFVAHYAQHGKAENALGNSTEDRKYFGKIDYGSTDPEELALGLDALTDEEFAAKVSEPDNGLVPRILRDGDGNTDIDGKFRQELINILVKRRRAFG